jgi:hypothetical protein
MSWTRSLRRMTLTAALAALLISGMIWGADRTPPVRASEPPLTQDQTPPQTSQENPLTIDTDPTLPPASPHALYQFQLIAHGGYPPLHWRKMGALPLGIKLEENGMIHGVTERSGEFHFTAVVIDSRGGGGVRKNFTLTVRSGLTLNWKSIAHVNDNRIEGSVDISNNTEEDIDLTFVVLAVAENGRATAIGYQHFPLSRGTTEMELPFGDTLPPGGYVVHVDAIGEVDVHDRLHNRIYRERLQTQGPLSVTVGP